MVEPGIKRIHKRDGSVVDFNPEKIEAAIFKALAATGDAEMMSTWTLKHGGQEIFTMPRAAAIRSFVMSHIIHHRGQLSVSLRLKDVPLPPIYGPTADEA